MISTDELERLLRDIESDRVERPVSTRDTDKFSEAITAFANDLGNSKQPGYLLLGADNNGIPSGLTVTDNLLQSLAALRSNGNIQPLPAITVAKISLKGGEIAVVEVAPSDLPPVRYKGQVWIRIGPRRGIASEQEERMLTEKRIAHARTFDALPCLESSLSDLAIDLFLLTYLGQAVAAEILEANHRETGEQLASLRFYDSRRKCPTNAGILLFGRNPWSGFLGPRSSLYVLTERLLAPTF